jgi:hypothetical protein
MVSADKSAGHTAKCLSLLGGRFTPVAKPPHQLSHPLGGTVLRPLQLVRGSFFLLFRSLTLEGFGFATPGHNALLGPAVVEDSHPVCWNFQTGAF